MSRRLDSMIFRDGAGDFINCRGMVTKDSRSGLTSSIARLQNRVNGSFGGLGERSRTFCTHHVDQGAILLQALRDYQRCSP